MHIFANFSKSRCFFAFEIKESQEQKVAGTKSLEVAQYFCATRPTHCPTHPHSKKLRGDAWGCGGISIPMERVSSTTSRPHAIPTHPYSYLRNSNAFSSIFTALMQHCIYSYESCHICFVKQENQ